MTNEQRRSRISLSITLLSNRNAMKVRGDSPDHSSERQMKGGKRE